MPAQTTDTQLQRLRAGDRLRYHGVQWEVRTYSTYTDVKGYETEEWLLVSSSGKEYYLLREIDPQNPPLHWYLAEELKYPTILDPQTSRDRLLTLGDDMRSHQSPYPELQLFNRLYAFESQTEGTYESDGNTRSRITWDYWDKSHLWNLALEAWSDGTLVVYSTREVQPTDFSEIQSGTGAARLLGEEAAASNAFAAHRRQKSRSRELLIAWIVTIVGFILMVSG